MSRACLLVAAVALLIQTVLAQSTGAEVKSGWQTQWHGIGIGQQGVFKLPRACPVVAQAFEAAKLGDFARFLSFYEGAITNQPERIKSRYDDLNSLLKRYACLLGYEAVSTNEANGQIDVWSAMSIIPRELIDDNAAPDSESALKAIIIFAHLSNDGWRLLIEGNDEEHENVLRQQSDPLCYRPNAFSKKAVDQMVRQSHEALLEKMRKTGGSVPRITSMKEVFHVLESGVAIESWETWTNYYMAVVLDPPVVFDIRDEVEMDFSNPISACRSYHRAAFLRDAQTLTNYSDQYFGAELQKRYAKEKAYLANSATSLAVVSQSRITMLLTATTSLDGKDYTMVLWRAQDAESPAKKRVSFQKTYFVYDSQRKSYLLTEDLSHGSVFDSLFGLPGASTVGFSSYIDFYRKMEKSRFPKHFYTLEQ
ncbi:MAG: hypothetical protein KJ070_12080 [Verrucomicrobia bacterium]|nr:hypothetical protein [Verrucomicrobiota bacterium]